MTTPAWNVQKSARHIQKRALFLHVLKTSTRPPVSTPVLLSIILLIKKNMFRNHNSSFECSITSAHALPNTILYISIHSKRTLFLYDLKKAHAFLSHPQC
jgi:hypothetical protein